MNKKIVQNLWFLNSNGYFWIESMWFYLIIIVWTDWPFLLMVYYIVTNNILTYIFLSGKALLIFYFKTIHNLDYISYVRFSPFQILYITRPTQPIFCNMPNISCFYLHQTFDDTLTNRTAVKYKQLITWHWLQKLN